MKKSTKIILAAVAAVVVVGLFVGIWLATRPETSQGTKTITVEVVHSDGAGKTFTYHTDEEYLGAVLLAEKLVEGDEGPFGLMITAVDGETASWDENQSYWALYIGEEYAATGADTTPIADGGSFRLVYTVG